LGARDTVIAAQPAAGSGRLMADHRDEWARPRRPAHGKTRRPRAVPHHSARPGQDYRLPV